MSKRIATYQINNKNPVNDDEEEYLNSSESECENNQADEQELKRRQISKPKGLLNRSGKMQKPTPSLGNLFAGLPTNPFSTGGTSGIPSAEPVNNTQDFQLKMRGLNKSFLNSAQKLYENCPDANFSKIFEQYKTHLASFSAKSSNESKMMDIEKKIKPSLFEDSLKSSEKPKLEFSLPKPAEVKPIFEMPMPTEVKPIFELPKPTEVKPLFEMPVKPIFEMPKPTEVKPIFELPKPTEVKPVFEMPKPTEVKPIFEMPKPTEAKPVFEMPVKPIFEMPKPSEAKPVFELPKPTEVKPIFEMPKSTEVAETSAEAKFIDDAPSVKHFALGSTTESAVSSFKPFSFGSTESSNLAPAFKPFSFGSSGSNDAPVSTTFSLKTNGPVFPAPAPNFSFGSTTFLSAPVKKTSLDDQSGGEDGGNDEIPPEEAESFSITRTNNDQLKTGAGEENETSQHEERCKVFTLDRTGGNGWIDLGVGIFKINRYNNEIGKSRILCRAEGSGKVIINTLVSVPGMDVTTIEGKKEVALLAIGPEGKPTKFLIRVKTMEQAVSLKSALLSEIEYVKSNKPSS